LHYGHRQSAPLGEASLESYRFYLLSLQNHIGAAVYLDARDDADALDKAPTTFAVSNEFPAIEVWRGKRMVGRINQRT
jgi:hypothetical protein